MSETKAQEFEQPLETVAAEFAHDLSTPLTTAQLNANLLVEHAALLEKIVASEDGARIPVHLRNALLRAPALLQQNLQQMQGALQTFKHQLNNLAAPARAEVSAVKRHVSYTVNPHQYLKILLVDDEEIHHDIGEAVLGVQHEIHHALSGVDAIARCHEEHFDIILMDIQMPIMPGPQTTVKLRAFIPKTTLILGLTNMPIESKKATLLENGFNGFLEKPLKLRAFNQMLADINAEGDEDLE